MLNTPKAYGGMATAPHHLASSAGAAILRDGGNALEAMIAMAATIAVVYPHMNSLGGDGFWLIAEPGREPVGIQACGAAAKAADFRFYAERGVATIPARGGAAALTSAGTVAGWAKAKTLAEEWGGRMKLGDLLADAIRHARDGVAVTGPQSRLTTTHLDELRDVPGFSALFLAAGAAPLPGTRFSQPALAATLMRLAEAGLEDFYRGDIARALAADLEAAGSPVGLADLATTVARAVQPLSVGIGGALLTNMPPPTQGVASLLILAIFSRLGIDPSDEAMLVHGLVEATKEAFALRNAEVFDPAYMAAPAETFLAADRIDAMASRIDLARAAEWPAAAMPGDTVWMGAIDGQGRAVSFIQSTYWEFGSGVVSPQTGIVWQNRGMSFSLDPTHPNALAPGRLPFHTLNPALARFADGRTMIYGTMGGDGQPQTQAQIFARVAWLGMEPQAAVSAPRFLLGRTWGEESTNLKLEAGFPQGVAERLAGMGHAVAALERFSHLTGHAGAILREPDGLLRGAADPRSDGAVAAL